MENIENIEQGARKVEEKIRISNKEQGRMRRKEY
jgi:hypothetical protein